MNIISLREVWHIYVQHKYCLHNVESLKVIRIGKLDHNFYKTRKRKVAAVVGYVINV